MTDDQTRISYGHSAENGEDSSLLVVFDRQQTSTGLADAPVAYPKIQLALNNGLLDLGHDRLAVVNRAADGGASDLAAKRTT